MWFAQSTTPGSARFQCAELVHFRGPIDVEKLATTIERCQSSIDVLGMDAIIDDRGELVWRSAGPAPRVRHATEVPSLCVPAMTTPGVITAEEIWCNTIVTQADGSVSWHLRFHHVLADGYLANTFIRWVAHCYACADPQEYPPSPLKTHAQTCATDGIATTEDVSFWASQTIPAETGHWVSGQGEETDRVAGFLSRAVRQGLRKHGQELSVLAVLVGYTTSVFSRVEEVTLGFPLMNRPLGVRTLAVSPEVTVVPLTMCFPAKTTIGDAVTAAQAAIATARAHASVRPEDIRHAHTDLIPGTRYTGPNLNFKPFRGEFRFDTTPAEMETLAIGPIEDAELIFVPTANGGLEIQCLGRGDRIEMKYRVRALEHLAQEIAQSSPSTSLCDLSLSNTPTPYHPPVPAQHMTLTGLVRSRRTRERWSDTVCLVRADATVMTKREAWARIDSIAAHLLERGTKPGTIIAVEAQRTPELLLTLAAIALIGGAFLPLAPGVPEERRKAMCGSAQPLFIVDPAQISASEPPKQLFLPQPPDATDPAYILFTSGSTGAPKGVEVPQQAVAMRLEWMVADLGLTSEDRIMQKTPASFDVSVWELLLAFTHGVQVAVASPDAHRDPYALGKELAVTGATVCHFVPSALAAFLTTEPPLLEHLRTIVTSGEALAAELAHRCRTILGVELHNYYGPTEAAIDVTAYMVRGDEETIPIGVPTPGTWCYILDRYGRLLPEGALGELYICGPQVASGYIGMPEKTDEVFLPDPRVPGARMYRTGDLARWGVGGVLYYGGRVDDQVKLHGQRLEPGEISCVLQRHSAVSECLVLAREIAGDLALVAYIVPVTGHDLATEEDAIHAYLRAYLPEYMIPRWFVSLPAIPLGPHGKVDRKALPTPAITSGGEAPSTPREREIAAIVAELNGGHATTMGVDANLFALGVTSLTAVQITQQIHGLTIADIFATPTIRGLAKRADSTDGQAGEDAFAQLVCLREGTGVPIICFHPAGGIGWVYSGLLAFVAPDRPLYIAQSPGLIAGSAQPESICEAASMALALIRDRVSGVCDFVGWSVGGVIAQEAAVQAEDLVRKLVLLDSYPAEVWKGLQEPTEQERLSGVYTMAGIDTPAGELTVEGAVAAVRDAGGAFGALPPDVIRRVTRLIGHNASIMRAHATRKANISVEFFRAEYNPDTHDPASWIPFVGDMRVVTLPVNHPGLVRRQSLQVVAKALN